MSPREKTALTVPKTALAKMAGAVPVAIAVSRIVWMLSVDRTDAVDNVEIAARKAFVLQAPVTTVPAVRQVMSLVVEAAPVKHAFANSIRFAVTTGGDKIA